MDDFRLTARPITTLKETRHSVTRIVFLRMTQRIFEPPVEMW